MIDRIWIEADTELPDVTAHWRRVLRCDRCPRWAFTRIFEAQIDGKPFDVCEACIETSLRDRSGVTIGRQVRVRDRLEREVA
jgi:hypothetical protein